MERYGGSDMDLSSSPEKAALTAMYGGGGSALIFGLSANDFFALVGAVVAVVGLVANLWFKYQHLKIAREAAAKMDKEDA